MKIDVSHVNPGIIEQKLSPQKNCKSSASISFYDFLLSSLSTVAVTKTTDKPIKAAPHTLYFLVIFAINCIRVTIFVIGEFIGGKHKKS